MGSTTTTATATRTFLGNRDDDEDDRRSVRSVLREGAARLEARGVTEPKLSCAHLMAECLGLPWETGFSELLSSEDDDRWERRVASRDERARFSGLLARRERHEPLQYVLGKWDFHLDLTLSCRAPVLCPRPETEELVELCLDEIRRRRPDDSTNRRPLRILDVGCGTGAIGIALARHAAVDAEVVALDVSPEAVALSKENAAAALDDDRRAYQVRLCSAADFTNHDRDTTTTTTTTPPLFDLDFDLVVSNPPYVPAADMADLSPDVVDHEDHNALCGGDDGLDVVRDIVRRLPEWTASESDNDDDDRCCWMEVDTSHPEAIRKWLSRDNDVSDAAASNDGRVVFEETRRDLSGRERFVKLRVVR